MHRVGFRGVLEVLGNVAWMGLSGNIGHSTMAIQWLVGKAHVLPVCCGCSRAKPLMLLVSKCFGRSQDLLANNESRTFQDVP